LTWSMVYLCKHHANSWLESLSGIDSASKWDFGQRPVFLVKPPRFNFTSKLPIVVLTTSMWTWCTWAHSHPPGAITCTLVPVLTSQHGTTPASVPATFSKPTLTFQFKLYNHVPEDDPPGKQPSPPIPAQTPQPLPTKLPPHTRSGWTIR
jgi:hypothetical protein